MVVGVVINVKTLTGLQVLVLSQFSNCPMMRQMRLLGRTNFFLCSLLLVIITMVYASH